LTIAIAIELELEGIKVNAISPSLRARKRSRKTGHSVAESLQAEIASEAGHTFAEHNHD